MLTFGFICGFFHKSMLKYGNPCDKITMVNYILDYYVRN